MKINVFLLCHNESAILPHTIKHYKTHLPSCTITIYDNESTDNSVKIAKSFGCRVISFKSHNILDEPMLTNIRNNCWKTIKDGVIIVADMDEYICITEAELMAEINMGTTILRILGINMIGESQTIDLSDIDLQLIKKYVDEDPISPESKNLCFLRESIIEMNYGVGAHYCSPQGIIKYSAKIYYNKHMSYLGVPFITNKMIKRYERSHQMRKQGLSIHYTDDVDKIYGDYTNKLSNSKLLNMADPIAELNTIMNRQSETLTQFNLALIEQSNTLDQFNKILLGNTDILSNEIKSILSEQATTLTNFNTRLIEQSLNLSNYNTMFTEQTSELREEFNTAQKEQADTWEQFNTQLLENTTLLSDKMNDVLIEQADILEKFNKKIIANTLVISEEV